MKQTIPSTNTELQTSRSTSFLGSLNLKYIVIGLSLLLIGLLSGWYLGIRHVEKNAEVTPKQEQIEAVAQKKVADTSEWQEYLNKEYGFKFRYPKKWTASQSRQVFENGDLIFVGPDIASKNDRTESDTGAFIAIAVPIKINSELKTWVKKYFTEHHADPSAPLEFSQAILNDVEFERVYTCGLGCYNYYITLHNDRVFQLISFVGESGNQKYADEMNQILTTFKFLEKQPLIEVSQTSLRTYDNSQYQFSFSIPSGIALTENRAVASGIPYQINVSNSISITVRDPKITKDEVLRNWTQYEEVSVGNTYGYKTQSIGNIGPIGGNSTDSKVIQYLVDLPRYNLFIFYNESLEQNNQEGQAILNQIVLSLRFLNTY